MTRFRHFYGLSYEALDCFKLAFPMLEMARAPFLMCRDGAKRITVSVKQSLGYCCAHHTLDLELFPLLGTMSLSRPILQFSRARYFAGSKPAPGPHVAVLLFDKDRVFPRD